ncbi:MAG: class I SAM-dependent methyltransferase [Chitinophagaceae bacterium]|nr:class I SAM-dependent methyltransferase [Chitinophagaceae bacterium]
MPDFEKLYYEDEVHWEHESLQDPANRERIHFTASLIPEDVKSLADIGCGNGVFVNFLQTARPGLKILAVDRSTTALKYVQTEKKLGDISGIPAENSAFDCVTCLEVIEHLPVQVYEKALQELARIAKDYIIISVPYLEELEENHTQCPSCKTIFNYDLHMRSFSDETMKHLMDKYGFSCTSIHHLGMSIHFKGHYTFRKLFYKDQFRKWRSPICPLCGYNEKAEPAAQANNSSVAANRPSSGRKLISYFTAVPKLFWPKEKKYYWIIGLYKKNA